MKKLIVLLLVLVSVSIWGTELTSEENLKIENDVNKKIEQFQNDNVESIVIGKVTNVEVNLYKRRPDSDLSEKNVVAITKVTFKVEEAYKSEFISKEIIVRISGGKFIFNSKQYASASRDKAHPLLDEGDIILMGLKKENEYYKHVNGRELQIPFDNNLIEQIEEQRKEHKIKKLKKIREREQASSDNYLSEEEISIVTEKEKIKKKVFILKLKEKLDNSFLETEVTDE